MKKVLAWRERRDEWFRSMFGTCFAESHEVREEKKLGLFGTAFYWPIPPPHPPRLAKHPDYEALETRLRAVEQKVCDHAFCDRQKGCMDSIFCSKCGALSPDWEKAPSERYDDNGDVRDDWIEPKVYANGTGYVRKAKTRKR